MANNNILPFAPVDTGTNLEAQAAYQAAFDRTNGNQPGVARSKLVNKALRQSSIMAAGFAQYLANRQQNDLNDNLTPAQVELIIDAAFKTAEGSYAGSKIVTSNTTLLATDVGKVININAADVVVVLPSVNGLRVGSTFLLSGYSYILNRNGADSVPINTSRGSFTSVRFFGIVSVTWQGVAWQMQTVGEGAVSLSINGYFQHSNGLLDQWGSVNVPDLAGAQNFNVTFPMALPGGGVFSSIQVGDDSNQNAVIRLTNRTATGFIMQVVESDTNIAGHAMMWRCIGH